MIPVPEIHILNSLLSFSNRRNFTQEKGTGEVLKNKEVK